MRSVRNSREQLLRPLTVRAVIFLPLVGVAAIGCERPRGGTSVTGDARATAPLAPPATKGSLADRVRESIERFEPAGPLSCPHYYTIKKEVIQAIREATPESVRRPVLVSSNYFVGPTPPDVTRVVVAWIEDTPSLKRVTVINPSSKKQYKAEIPEKFLKNRANFDEHVIIRGYPFDLPSAAIDPAIDQTLIIRNDESGQEAKCYPCFISEKTGEPIRPSSRRVLRPAS